MAEIELKFELPAGWHGRFARLEPLRGDPPRTQRLHALYFDTPGFALRRREMALRLRRTGRAWVQTLKAGRSGAGGLHAREEWEQPRARAVLDTTLLPQLPELGEALQEIFRVDVRRTTWRLAPLPGSEVEVALDRGEVSAAGGREAISEVEIESLNGDPEAIFVLAERLVDLAPLRPSAITKAQRGYRLAGGEPESPLRAGPPRLEAAMTPRQAAHASIASALEQLQGNEAGVLRGDDPEYLHQFRIALRRLRSALRVFGAVLPADLVSHARQELRWVAQLAGPARDWDVLATATLPAILAAYGGGPGIRSVPRRAASRRREALEALRGGLESPRYARLVLLLSRWLITAPAGDAGSAPPLAAYAARVMRKRHGELLEGASRLSVLGPAERHALRLEAKRLRYAAQGFAGLFRRKHVDAYVDILSDIQEDLGRANDAAVAARLLDNLALPSGFAQFARGWLAARSQDSVADIERHGERLAAARRFWEKA